MKTPLVRAFILLFILLISQSIVAQNNNWHAEFNAIKDKGEQIDWVFNTIYTENRYKEVHPEILEAGFKLATIVKSDSNTAKLYLSKAKYEQREHNVEAAWANCQQAKILFLRSRKYDYAAEVLFVQCQLLLHQGEGDSIVNMLSNQKTVIRLASPAKQGRLQNMFANGHNAAGNADVALQEYKNVVAWAERLQDTSTLLAAYSNIGALSNNSDSMLVWYRKILSLSNPEGRFANRYVNALFRIGYEYTQRDGILKDSALYYFLEAEKYADKEESPVFKMNLYNALGTFFSSKDENNLALPYFRKSFQYSSPSFAKTNLTILNLASTFVSLRQQDSAYYYLQLCKKRLDEKQDDYAYLNYHQTAAEFEKLKGDSCGLDVLRNYNEALKFAVKLKNDWHSSALLSLIIPCLTQNAKLDKERLDIAKATLQYCSFFYQPLKDANNRLVFSVFLKNYAALESHVGSKEMAAELYKELSEILSRVNDENYAKGMGEMLIKYKSEIKDAEIAFGQRMNLLLMTGLVFLFIVGVYIFINFRRTNILNKKITEQKAELEKLANTQQVMFSVISHDLRAPINSLHAVVNVLGDDGDYAHRMPEYTKLLSKSLGAAEGLLNNLLLWTSTQMQGYKVDITQGDIQKVLQENIELFSKEAMGKNITVTDLLQGTLTVNTDHSVIKTIVRNLLSNAIKFTPNGGTILLNAAIVKNELCISVRDSGVGIAKEDLDKLFDKTNLHTTTGTNKEMGTGIGLSLCYELVQLLNGNIKVESAIGSGTLFSVHIPLA
ncbi:MAG: ATP-binding protein [Bacteroidota bacterium]